MYYYFYESLRKALLKKNSNRSFTEKEIDDFVKDEALKFLFEMVIKNSAVGWDLINAKVKEIIGK